MDFKTFSGSSIIKPDQAISDIGDQVRDQEPGRCMYFNNGWKVITNGTPNNKWTGTLWFKTPEEQLYSNKRVGVLFGNDGTNSRFWGSFGFNKDNHLAISNAYNDFLDPPELEILVGTSVIWDANNKVTAMSNESYTDNNWHFLYFDIFSKSHRDLYFRAWIDGDLVLLINHVSIGMNRGPIGIGGHNKRDFTGYLYDVRLWKDFITEQDVQLAKQGRTDTSIIPTHHYWLNEGSGRIAYNSIDGFGGAINGGSSDISTVHVTDGDLPFVHQNDYGFNPASVYNGVYDSEDEFSKYSVKIVYISQIGTDVLVIYNWYIINDGSSNLLIEDGNLKVEHSSSTLWYNTSFDYSQYLPTVYPRRYKLTLNINLGDTPSLDLTIDNVVGESQERLNTTINSNGEFTIEFPKAPGKLRFKINPSGGTHYYLNSFKIEDIDEQLVPKSSTSKYLDVHGKRLEKYGKVRYPVKYKESNCLEFDGNSYVNFGNVPELEVQNFEMSGYFTKGSNNKTLLSYQYDADNANGLTLNSNNGNFGIKVFTTGSDFTTGVDTIINGINYFVIQVRGSKLSVKFNGNLYNYTLNSSPNFDVGETVIGRRNRANGGDLEWYGSVFGIKVKNLSTNQELLNIPLSEGGGSAVHNVAKDAPAGTEVAQIQTSNDYNNLWKTQDHFHYNINNGFRREIYEYSDGDFHLLKNLDPEIILSQIDNGFRITTTKDFPQTGNHSLVEIPSELIQLEDGGRYQYSFNVKMQGQDIGIYMRITIFNYQITTSDSFQLSNGDNSVSNDVVRVIRDTGTFPNGITIIVNQGVLDKYLRPGTTLDFTDFKIEQLSYIPLNSQGVDPYGNSEPPRITNPATNAHNLAETKLDFQDGKINSFNSDLPSAMEMNLDYDNVFKMKLDKEVDNLIVQNDYYDQEWTSQKRIIEVIEKDDIGSIEWDSIKEPINYSEGDKVSRLTNLGAENIDIIQNDNQYKPTWVYDNGYPVLKGNGNWMDTQQNQLEYIQKRKLAIFIVMKLNDWSNGHSGGQIWSSRNNNGGNPRSLSVLQTNPGGGNSMRYGFTDGSDDLNLDKNVSFLSGYSLIVGLLQPDYVSFRTNGSEQDRISNEVDYENYYAPESQYLLARNRDDSFIDGIYSKDIWIKHFSVLPLATEEKVIKKEKELLKLTD